MLCLWCPVVLRRWSISSSGGKARGNLKVRTVICSNRAFPRLSFVGGRNCDGGKEGRHNLERRGGVTLESVRSVVKTRDCFFCFRPEQAIVLRSENSVIFENEEIANRVTPEADPFLLTNEKGEEQGVRRRRTVWETEVSSGPSSWWSPSEGREPQRSRGVQRSGLRRRMPHLQTQGS